MSAVAGVTVRTALTVKRGIFCYGNEFTDDTMNEIITAMDMSRQLVSACSAVNLEKEIMAAQYILKQ